MSRPPNGNESGNTFSGRTEESEGRRVEGFAVMEVTKKRDGRQGVDPVDPYVQLATPTISAICNWKTP